MKNEGLAIHCHHDQLIEWCHSYQERVDYINSDKPEGERAVRLRLFKLLPQAAIKELPKSLGKACADKYKANVNYRKANADWFVSARAEWHTKWCGCTEWDGQEVRFR